MDILDGAGRVFGIVKKSIIFLNSHESFDTGAPHIEKKSFETVRFVILMKARSNCPVHLITMLSLLSPTREILLTF